MKNRYFFILITLLLMVSVSCEQSSTSTAPTTSPTTMRTTTPSVVLTLSQIKYLLLDAYPDYFWCDPDYYPVGSPERELQNALAQFPAIQANIEEFTVILKQLSLDNKTNYTDQEKLLIYRQHKLLNLVVTLSPSTNGYDYSLRIGTNQGFLVQGTVSSSGQIYETARDMSFNTCPICLSKGTLIDAPQGPVQVEQLAPGMSVWTQDATGNRIAEPILKTSSTPVPSGFQVLEIVLSGGRTVEASPGHPTPDYRPLSDYRVGDHFEGSIIVDVERVEYAGGFTYDLLPDSGTGVYWANGILLLSTLPHQ